MGPIYDKQVKESWPLGWQAHMWKLPGTNQRSGQTINGIGITAYDEGASVSTLEGLVVWIVCLHAAGELDSLLPLLITAAPCDTPVAGRQKPFVGSRHIDMDRQRNGVVNGPTVALAVCGIRSGICSTIISHHHRQQQRRRLVKIRQ